jgi:hypothetical protein
MTKLKDQIEKTLLQGMSIPREIELLFSWIEENRLFVDTTDGRRIGFLFPEEEMKSSWTDKERLGGTDIEFSAAGNIGLKPWFGHDRAEILNRLCVFAKTGYDGSMAAFWIDEQGSQKIVHLGSGSGSTLVCILADKSVDFLRLLAIGYEDICFSEEQFSSPPNVNCTNNDCLYIHPNIAYQQWVKNTFSVEIPNTAGEIVKFPSELGDMDSKDPFCQWIEQNS